MTKTEMEDRIKRLENIISDLLWELNKYDLLDDHPLPKRNYLQEEEMNEQKDQEYMDLLRSWYMY